MPEVGEKAPEWSLRTLSGERVRFPNVAEDRPAIVLFWATWCPYCKALMPRLKDLQAEFSDSGLQVFAVNFSEQSDPTAKIQSLNLPFIHLLKGDAAARTYDINAVPALFLVDKGRIVYRLDYPPSDHESQRSENKSEQPQLLAPWWEGRIRDALRGIKRGQEK